MREEDKFRKSKEEKKHKNLPVSPQNQKKKKISGAVYFVSYFFFFQLRTKLQRKGKLFTVT